MSDIKTAILNAAERRMQFGGLAASAFGNRRRRRYQELECPLSLPDEGKLGSRRHSPLGRTHLRAYRGAAGEKPGPRFRVDQCVPAGPPYRKGISAHAPSSAPPRRICRQGRVASEVRGFFKMCLDKLVAEGLSVNAAARVLSTLTGALVLANALGDTGAYDRATKDLLQPREPVPAPTNSATARVTASGCSNSRRCPARGRSITRTRSPNSSRSA